MAKKKKETADNLKELKAKIQDGKVVIGRDRVLKELKSKQLDTVYLANNCPDKMRTDLEYYAKLAGTSVEELPYNNEELGVFCKKNFLVTVIGTIKE